VTAADGGQGASLLWWPQEVTPQETLWALAKEATAAVKRETEARGGLAFWARMHADKTMFEAMGQDKPPYNPPYTVRAPVSLCMHGAEQALHCALSVVPGMHGAE
jgi:hypothetical protein